MRMNLTKGKKNSIEIWKNKRISDEYTEKDDKDPFDDLYSYAEDEPNDNDEKDSPLFDNLEGKSEAEEIFFDAIEEITKVTAHEYRMGEQTPQEHEQYLKLLQFDINRERKLYDDAVKLLQMTKKLPIKHPKSDLGKERESILEKLKSHNLSKEEMDSRIRLWNSINNDMNEPLHLSEDQIHNGMIFWKKCIEKKHNFVEKREQTEKRRTKGNDPIN